MEQTNLLIVITIQLQVVHLQKQKIVQTIAFATLLSEYPSDPTGGFANANTTAKSNADSTSEVAFSSIATILLVENIIWN